MNVTWKVTCEARCSGCDKKSIVAEKMVDYGEVLATNQREWWVTVVQEKTKELVEALKAAGWLTVNLTQAASGRRFARYFCPTCAGIAKKATEL